MSVEELQLGHYCETQVHLCSDLQQAASPRNAPIVSGEVMFPSRCEIPGNFPIGLITLFKFKPSKVVNLFLFRQTVPKAM